MDIWTSAQTQKNNGVGRGNSAANHGLYGIKKLRELILELAVRGKLVPQDPNSEPASVLLEKIAKEKARLITAGKIKKEQPLPEISEDEKPFELPKGWTWSRFQDVTSYIQRGKGPIYADQGNVRVISQKCIQWSGFDLSKSRYVDDSSLDTYQPERFLESGDLLWNSTGTGTVGRINVLEKIVRKTLVADSHVTVMRPLKVDSNFLCRYVSAPGIQRRIDPEHEDSLVTGTTNQVELNTSAVQSLLVPVPPLAEQHRIVIKVDELMTLCDQLENQQTHNNTIHQTMVETMLDTLTTAAKQDESSVAWQRITNSFDALFINEQSIEHLKQTILQLAVMGKLVHQNNKDESASVLLKKISESLCNENNIESLPKLKRDKSIIDPTDFHYPIPVNWIWCELQDISIFTNGKAHEQHITKEPKYILINSRFVSTNGEIIKYATERLTPLEKGDIAIVMSDVPDGRALVRCFLVECDDKYTLNQRIGCITSSKEINKRYVMLVLDRNKYYLQYDDGKKQTNLKKIQIMSCPIPLPPLAEQNRIVAKVDELIALSDTIKSHLKEAQTTKVQLADAIVEQAVG